MSSKYVSLALGLAILAAAPATVAEAADWNNGAGGIKDSRAAGIPVPAPIPVMEHFRWYLRADVGGGIYGGIYGGGDASERGMFFGLPDSSGRGAPAPFGTSSSWFSSEFDTFAVGSVGAGMYISPRLRGDVTIDARTVSELNGSGTYAYTVTNFGPPTMTATGTYTDRALVRDTSAMFNLYYDIKDRGALTPYVGVGLGFTNRHIERTIEATEVRSAPGIDTGSVTQTGTSKANVVAPSASLTAGAAYALHAGLVLDFNYRYMYIGGVDTTTRIGTSDSIMKLDATHEHALRAGVRLNVW